MEGFKVTIAPQNGVPIIVYSKKPKTKFIIIQKKKKKKVIMLEKNSPPRILIKERIWYTLIIRCAISN